MGNPVSATGNPVGWPRIVILTPVYNEEGSLPIYERTVSEVLLSRTEYDFRVLFIEDGSRDRSWE
ncbi:MAG: glycosyltransferase, partial [Chloroflexi bacterium]|nr:glycosyltransferase [Chloroflexota bacterium]